MRLFTHTLFKGSQTLKATTALACLLATAPALAAPDAPTHINSGDTAWMLTCTALVLLMTLPGLALFYGGMVRAKNVLSVMMQCFVITCLVSVLWTICGYSLVFTDGGSLNGFIGGLDELMMAGIQPGAMVGGIPESVFFLFQLTFAIITPALIVGAFAERMKFSSILVFLTLWTLFCYIPIAHMVWGHGWLQQLGLKDFAGGTVVEVNSGIAGLVCAIALGKRHGHGRTAMAPHNLGYTLIGGSLLWVGWLAFNGGSALAADSRAGMALVATQLAAAAGALAWMFCEWWTHESPSVLGIASGAVAGLVAITPASGFVTPGGALIIGMVAGMVCLFAATWLKHYFGYDDSLDVFGVHCVGGIVGTLLTGIFFLPQIAGHWGTIGLTARLEQFGIQLIGVAFTLVYSGVASIVLLWITKRLTNGLRVSLEEETMGLDLAQHNERGYNL